MIETQKTRAKFLADRGQLVPLTAFPAAKSEKPRFDKRAYQKAYMRKRRAAHKVAAAAVVLLLFCGCASTSPTPTSETQVTYRSHAKAGLQQDSSKRMIHYYDSPPGIWYDVAGAKWTFDEDGWRKL
jgi:hypothetical protein